MQRVAQPVPQGMDHATMRPVGTGHQRRRGLACMPMDARQAVRRHCCDTRRASELAMAGASLWARP
jgi:hypothetical protein